MSGAGMDAGQTDAGQTDEGQAGGGRGEGRRWHAGWGMEQDIVWRGQQMDRGPGAGEAG